MVISLIMSKIVYFIGEYKELNRLIEMGFFLKKIKISDFLLLHTCLLRSQIDDHKRNDHKRNDS